MFNVLKRIIEILYKTRTEDYNYEIEEIEYEWENSEGEVKYLYENVFSDIERTYFGIEIEFQIDKAISGEYIVNIFRTNGIEINKEIVEDRKNKGKYNSWQLMKESTCDWEIISPILQDDIECWRNIENVCNILKNELQANIDEKTSIHLHIQREPLINKGKHYINLMNLYKYLEPFTYAFSAGEESEISLLRVKKYAGTLKFADKCLWSREMSQSEAQEIIENGSNYDLINSYFPIRLLGLNFSTRSTEYKTIEFRTFNGTLNPTIIQSYLIYVMSMINLAKQDDFDNKYKPVAIEDESGKKVLSKKYIDKCLSLLTKNKMYRDRFLQPLIRNSYTISDDLYDALNGKYAEEEKRAFLLF
ncbi:hypothetical protein FDB29_08950 [Clostridium botulinum]|nr:hypothetical protein [Clostridium botulinum]